MNNHVAVLLGIDESTTKTGIGVRSDGGAQRYFDIKNRGAVRWHGAKAFDLRELPGMILDTLDKLTAAGWSLGAKGALSCSVRQHDMVLLDANDRLLIPALTWQCNAAKQQVAELVSQGAEATVGKLAERFILPKLMWAIAQQPNLRRRIAKVMTTGDWLAYMLTGKLRLSTSDALSNGLLKQSDKTLAKAVITKAGLDPKWFPRVIDSGTFVGKVRRDPAARGPWAKLQTCLAGWSVVAGLGDNHATGVGCGGLADDRTIVVSAGTSGTINRRVAPTTPLRGQAACFEFYADRLLLMMLADCGAWYKQFYRSHRQGKKYPELNDLSLAADLGRVVRVRRRGKRSEYPANWQQLSLGEQVASTQISITLELLLLVRAMLAEAPSAPAVKRFVLTGGLSQAPLMQQAFHAGIQILSPGGQALVSALDDKLSFQTAAYGALLNALLPQRQGDLVGIVRDLCPLKPCPAPPDRQLAALTKAMRAELRS